MFYIGYYNDRHNRDDFRILAESKSKGIATYIANMYKSDYEKNLGESAPYTVIDRLPKHYSWPE